MPSESEPLKPGDVVRLKSGGPDMTILNENKDDKGHWDLAWFAGPEGVKYDTLPGVALKKLGRPAKV
jgi:uncharacterized protein YodC (DUF2158 family)